jgi:hypothetical protein
MIGKSGEGGSTPSTASPIPGNTSVTTLIYSSCIGEPFAETEGGHREHP